MNYLVRQVKGLGKNQVCHDTVEDVIKVRGDRI